MIFFTLLKSTFLFLLVILMLILIIPIDYNLEISKYADVILKGRIGCFWRLLKINLTIVMTKSKIIDVKILGFPISLRPKRKEKSKKIHNKQLENEMQQKKDKRNFSLSMKYFSKDLLNAILVTFKDILKHLKPTGFTLKATYGFDDPYYTGLLLVITSSLYPLVKDSSTIEIIPSFEETTIKGEMDLQGRIVVILLVLIILKLIFQKPIRRIIKMLFNKKKEEKRYVN